MPALKKYVNILAFLALFGSLAACASGNGSRAVSIKYAELLARDSGFIFSADIDYRLGATAIDALRNGIPLYWEVKINVVKQRRFLWNAIVAEKKLRYRIQYHALLNMYRVFNENSGEISNFSTLAAALDLMSSIRYMTLFKHLQLDSKERYLAGVKVNFDRESLPLPLRPIAYLNPEWYLSSNSYLWLLTN